MGEELAAASVAALDFIENQDSVVFRTSLAESMHEFVCRQLDAAYTLYAFDNHCADISFGPVSYTHLRRTGYIEEEDVETLNEWRKDPAHWESGK